MCEMYFSLSRSIGDSNISLDRLRAAALRNFVLVSFEIILRFYLKVCRNSHVCGKIVPYEVEFGRILCKACLHFLKFRFYLYLLKFAMCLVNLEEIL